MSDVLVGGPASTVLVDGGESTVLVKGGGGPVFVGYRSDLNALRLRGKLLDPVTFGAPEEGFVPRFDADDNMWKAAPPGALSVVDWDNVTGKPATFPPSAHTHPWADITARPTTLAGYGITDALTEADADAAYAPLVHAHPWSDLSSFVGSSLAQLATRAYSDLQGIPATFAPAAHRHAVADLDDFGAAAGYLRSTGSAWARVSGVAWGDLTGVPGTFTPSAHTHPAADIVSGTFADERIASSSVTQYQGALAIAWGQLTGVPSTFAPSAHTHPLADLTGFGLAGGYARSDGGAWVRVSGVAWWDLTGVPATFAPSAHTHPWGDVTGTPATLGGYGITDGALDADLDAHTARTDNPHAVTKAQVGLGSVENTALSTWAGSANVTILGTIDTGTWNATAIAWAKVDKTGSSLADLATRSAADLTSGNLAYARMPTLTGTWNLGGVTETLTLDAAGLVIPATGTARIIVGHTAGIAGSQPFATATQSGTPGFQINGGNVGSSMLQFSRWQSGVTTGAGITLAMSRSDTVGTHLPVVTGNRVGALTFAGSDSAEWRHVARIEGVVDGTVSAGVMPGYLAFFTSAGVIAEKARLTTAGNLALVATAKFYLDGVVGTGDTYLVESSANVLDLVAGAATTLRLSATAATVTGTLTASGHAGLAATNRLYLDGVAMSGNTYVVESSADVLDLVAGGATTLRLNATSAAVTGTLSASGDFGVAATKKLYLDGVALSGNTYVVESSADVLDLVAGAATTLRLSATAATVTGTLTASGDFGVAATKKLYLDGVALSGNTYIVESGADVIQVFAGGNMMLTMNATQMGFFGHALAGRQTYTLANVVADRTFDPTIATQLETAQVLATFIQDMQGVGLAV